LVLWLLLSAILFAGEWVRRSGETNDPKFDPFTAIQGTQYESEPGAFVTAFNLAQYERTTQRLDAELSFKKTMARASISNRSVAMTVVAAVDPVVVIWAVFDAWLALARHRTWIEPNRRRSRRKDFVYGLSFLAGGALLMTVMFASARLITVPLFVDATTFLGRLTAMAIWAGAFLLARRIWLVNNRLYRALDEPEALP